MVHSYWHRMDDIPNLNLKKMRFEAYLIAYWSIHTPKTYNIFSSVCSNLMTVQGKGPPVTSLRYANVHSTRMERKQHQLRQSNSSVGVRRLSPVNDILDTLPLFQFCFTLALLVQQLQFLTFTEQRDKFGTGLFNCQYFHSIRSKRMTFWPTSASFQPHMKGRSFHRSGKFLRLSSSE